MADKAVFLDSNVWLYRLMDESRIALEERMRKQHIADELITTSELIIISTQVINEVCVNLIRKGGKSEAEIEEVIQDLYDLCEVVQIDLDVMLKAAELRQRFNLSFWDGLIVASAIAGHAEVLYSEDMQHGMRIDSLEIQNPFQR